MFSFCINNYTPDHVREHAHISIIITKSTNSEITADPVSNVINQFSLGLELVGINSDGRTNLARCKSILESNFDNTVVVDLGNTMFLMECLSHVLTNSSNEIVMHMQSDDDKVYTEVNGRNMQRCITWKKNKKVGKGL